MPQDGRHHASAAYVVEPCEYDCTGEETEEESRQDQEPECCVSRYVEERRNMPGCPSNRQQGAAAKRRVVFLQSREQKAAPPDFFATSARRKPEAPCEQS